MADLAAVEAAVAFGQWVADRRCQRGWSQQHVAQAVGVAPPRIRDIEEGAPLDRVLWERLAQLLGGSAE
jgi:transcriptional regulator with XRE-family HTH domain